MNSQTINNVAAEIADKFQTANMKKTQTKQQQQQKQQTSVGLGLSINSIFQSLVFHDVTFNMADLLRYGMLSAGILLVMIFLCPIQIFLILLVLIFIVLFLANLTITLMRKRYDEQSTKQIKPKKLNNLRRKYNIPQA